MRRNTSSLIKIFVVFCFVLSIRSAWTATFDVTPTSDDDCSDFTCDFQSALNSAGSNIEEDSINLASGIYNPPTGGFQYNPSDDNPITIEGSGPGNTVLDGVGTNTLLRIDTTLGIGGDSNSHIRIKGITFTNGASVTTGGGLFVKTFDADITVELSEFISNVSITDGGGMYGDSTNGMITITGCAFGDNSSIGSGGGVRAGTLNDTVRLSKNIFSDNSVNSSGGGAWVGLSSSTVILVNNIFEGNSSDNIGGGVYSETFDGSVTVTNNTFSNNSASSVGGGLYNLPFDNVAVVNIHNNIVWGNSSTSLGSDIYIRDDADADNTGATVNAFNNDFSDLFSVCQNTSGCTSIVNQGSNIDEDPLFVDAVGGDFHLTSNSPCINKGTASAPFFPSTDIDDEARPQGASPDIGADEAPVTVSGGGGGGCSIGTGLVETYDSNGGWIAAWTGIIFILVTRRMRAKKGK